MVSSNLEAQKNARKKGYAIPAINTQGGNFDIIWACCKAAEELQSPIILAHYVSTGAYSGNDWFAEVARWCAKKVSVPVSIHLDHGDSFEICMEALRLGFTSIMFDGSAKSIEENAVLTAEVVKAARCFGVPVEAEIGELQRLDGSGTPMHNKNTAEPAQIRRFLQLCSPDTLAVGIGNAHGYYSGKPDIRLDILKEAAEMTTIPLVLHGCTGMDEAVIKQAIQMGVSKINFGTEIRYKYVDHYKEGLETLNHQGHSWKLSQFANEKLAHDIQKIIMLAGSKDTL